MKVKSNFSSLIVYVFQNRGDPCNYRVREEETKRQRFGLMYRGGRLWSFAGSLWLFPGGLWSFADGLWLFTRGLWSFLVICGRLLMVCGRLLMVCGRLLVVCDFLLVVCGRCLFWQLRLQKWCNKIKSKNQNQIVLSLPTYAAYICNSF